MKKVLVFGITDKKDGVESVIMNYYRYLDKTKIQFDFLCNTEIVAYEDEITALGGKIYRITARSKNFIKYKKELGIFFKDHSEEYDAIWVNVCSLANIDYIKMAKKYGIKCRIIHSHNSENMDSNFRSILHRINRIKIKKYATDFWSCSEKAGEWFYAKGIIDSNKYRIINNAIDIKEFEYDKRIRNQYREELKIDNKIVIGNVGRMHFQKNHIFMLDIFSEFVKLNEDSVLILVGKGSLEELVKQKVEQLGIEDKVIFLGQRNDVNNLMQAMDVFLFPSKFEGLSLALLEAQTEGLLVFASKDVIAEENKFDDEIFQFISLNESPKKWAKEINLGISNIRERKTNYSLIKNTRFDIEFEANKLLEFFINL